MPDNPNEPNGWTMWGKHVLAELERQNKRLEEIDAKASRIEKLLVEGLAENRLAIAQEVSKVTTEIAMLKVKSGLWGAGAGLLTAVAMYIMTKL